jgi:hypothetical protein
MKTVWLDDLVWQHPPFPFVTWIEAAVKHYLANQGFDLAKPICRIRDEQGERWVQ